jgi:hypothetical protein
MLEGECKLIGVNLKATNKMDGVGKVLFRRCKKCFDSVKNHDWHGTIVNMCKI